MQDQCWEDGLGDCHVSIDWFKEKSTGKTHISQENLWFPVKIFP
jgi:hypothetical protein